LEVNPNYGNAYLLIGKMYAATSKSVFPNDGVLAYHNYRIVVRSPIQPPTVKGLPFSKSGCMKISSVEGR